MTKFIRCYDENLMTGFVTMVRKLIIKCLKLLVSALSPSPYRNLPGNVIDSVKFHNYVGRSGCDIIEIEDSNNLYIVRVYGGTLCVDSGVVIDAEENILIQSIGSLGRLQGWSHFFTDCCRKAKTMRVEDREIIFPLKHEGYYHFLIETLPRLLLAIDWARRNDHNIVVAVSSKMHAFIQEITKYLADCDAVILRKISGQTNIVAKDLLFIPLDDWFFVDVRLIQRLLKFRNLSLAQLHSPEESAQGVNIYVSRTRSPRRKMPFEEKVEQLMIEMGYEVVYWESMPVLEQWRLASNASRIVGFHGAGLANCIWMESGSHLIELADIRYPNFAFQVLSEIRGIKYSRIEFEQTEYECLFEELKSLNLRLGDVG